MVPNEEGDSPPENYAILTAAVRKVDWPEGDCIVAGATHLRWEFGSMPAAAGKPVQAVCAGRALLAHASSVNAKGCALCGDFNSWPAHAACLVLKEGLPTDHAEHPGGGVGTLALPRAEGQPDLATLRSAYAEAHEQGSEPLFTRKKNSASSQFCLDYVFVGGQALRVISAGFGPGPPYAPDGDGTDLAYLPCAEWPSDHLPLVAELQLALA